MRSAKETLDMPNGVSFAEKPRFAGDFDTFKEILPIVAIFMGGWKKTVRVEKIDDYSIADMAAKGTANDVSYLKGSPIGVLVFV